MAAAGQTGRAASSVSSTYADRNTATAADAAACLFSAKSFVAAMLAYYVALSINLAEPFWTVTTVYIVSLPLAGAVVSKALYRFAGTCLGAAVAVVLLPAFVNEPLILSFILASWLGFCVYVTQLDRTPRSYAFLLAGYTVSVIGFPSVLTPGSIFDTAIVRVQEIGIGIAATGLMHGLVLPRTVTKRLKELISDLICNAEQCSRRSLAGTRDPALDRERRRLASQVNGIEELAHHVAFDTERLLPRADTIRALEDALSWVLPVSGVLEDRVAECRALEEGIPPDIADVLRRTESLLATQIAEAARGEAVNKITNAVRTIEAAIGRSSPWTWRDILSLTLLARLQDLVRSHGVVRELREHALSGRILGLSSEATRLIELARGRSLHRDHGLALRSASGTMLAVCGTCVFWIMTSWSSGATAAVLVAIYCALIGGLPNPGVRIRQFFIGSLIGIGVAAIYDFSILPRVTEFGVLCAVLSPSFLLLGCMLARPPVAALALGAILSLINDVGLASTYQGDFAVFANNAFAQIVAGLTAVVIIDRFHVIGASLAFSRLYRAAFRDIAARADGKARDTRRWINRMIDRHAQITARLGPTGGHPALPPYDALLGMRIGYLAGELREISVGLAPSAKRAALEEVLSGISSHFHRISQDRRESVGDWVLNAIDRALSAYAKEGGSDERLRGVVLLAGLRQVLFPDIKAFVGPSNDR